MADDAAAALLYLSTHPGSTTTDVGKAIFEPEDDRELRNADRRVRYYFTEKYPELIRADDEASPTTYRIIDERVFSGLARLNLEAFDGETLSIGLGGTVMYVDEDETVHIDVVGDLELEEADREVELEVN